MVIMVSVVAVAFVFMASATRPVKSIFYRETGDLRRLGYNILNDMANNGVLDKLVLNQPEVKRVVRGGSPDCSRQTWVYEVRTYFSHVLPSGVGFRVRFYYYNITTGSFIPLHCGSISSGPGSRFVESEPIIYTYVSVYGDDAVRGIILRIDMELGFEG